MTIRIAIALGLFVAGCLCFASGGGATFKTGKSGVISLLGFILCITAFLVVVQEPLHHLH